MSQATMDYYIFDPSYYTQTSRIIDAPSLVFSFLFLLTVYVLMKTAKSASKHIKKLSIALLFLIFLGTINCVEAIRSGYDLYAVFDRISNYLYYLIILPVFLSILTHVNFDKNAGLWIGLMLGGSQILVSIVEAYYFSYKVVFAISATVLLILTLIWLRENKDFILNHLQLDESNQEEEDTSGPSDHLIE